MFAKTIQAALILSSVLFQSTVAGQDETGSETTNKRETSKPVFMAIDSSPWRGLTPVRPGRPRFVLYDDRSFVFADKTRYVEGVALQHYRSIRLSEEAYARLTSKLIPSDLPKLKPYYKTAPMVTDSPQLILFYWEKGQMRDIWIGGFCFEEGFADDDPTVGPGSKSWKDRLARLPKSLSLVVETMMGYENKNAKPWTPKHLEIIRTKPVWRGKSAKWPKGLPQTKDIVWRKPEANQYCRGAKAVAKLDGAMEPHLRRVFGENPVVYFGDGTATTVRFVFPREEEWMEEWARQYPPMAIPDSTKE